MIRYFQESGGHTKFEKGQKQAKNSQKWPKSAFFQTGCCYLEFFCKSHSFHSELGKIYLLEPFNTHTGPRTGQKQAKNGLKWPKLAFFKNLSLSFKIFLPISLIPLKARKNILIRSIKHLNRSHNRPKTGLKWPKMAQIRIFFQLIVVFSEFFCQSHSFHAELGKIYS